MSEAYEIDVTESALRDIRATARFIAIERSAPMNAERWLTRIWNAIDGLSQQPQRGQLAIESAFVELEIRQRVVGGYVILYTIDERRRTVVVMSIRHGRQRAVPHSPE